MSEIYKGVKFKFQQLGIDFNSEEAQKHAETIVQNLVNLPEDCSEGSAGNVSTRIEKGVLISRSGSNLKNLNFPKDFSLVVSETNERRIRYFGSHLPSSEIRMHSLIYSKRKDIKFCLHVHIPNVEKLQILDRYPVTEKFLSYGTIKLAEEAAELLMSSEIVVLRDHGIVIVGNDFSEIVKRVEQIEQL